MVVAAAAAAVAAAVMAAAAAPTTTAAAVPAAVPRLPASGGWQSWLRRWAAVAADVAAPPAGRWGLRATARVFPYTALAATYTATSTVTVDPSCPQSVTIGGGGSVDPATNVLILPLTSITEGAGPGAAQCRGGSMRVVRLATLLDAAAMEAAGLSAMSAALNASAPAASTVQSLVGTAADALVGWDGVERVCGTSTYPASTFSFFLIADQVIELQVGGMDRGTIPTNQQAMIIAAGGTRICALTAAKQVQPAPSPAPSPSPPPPVASPAPSGMPAPSAPSPTPTEAPSEEPEPTTGGEASPSAVPTVPTQSEEPIETAEPTGGPGGAPITAPDDGSACFPAAATLRRPGGEAVSMDALAVGDDVAVGGGHASRVYLFSHADAAAVSSMVELTTAAAGTLTASADHLVYVVSRDGRPGDRTAVAADTVAPGDVLVSDRADAAAATVVSVGRVRAVGLYAPHTLTGDLVVDGFVVSSYTRLLPPAVAHAVLAPVRAAAAAGLLPARLAQGGLWAGGDTPRRALDTALAAVRAAVAGVAAKSDL